MTVKSREKRKSCDNSRPDGECITGAAVIIKIAVFPKSRAIKSTRKMPLLRDGRIFRVKMKQEDIEP